MSKKSRRESTRKALSFVLSAVLVMGSFPTDGIAHALESDASATEITEQVTTDDSAATDAEDSAAAASTAVVVDSSDSDAPSATTDATASTTADATASTTDSTSSTSDEAAATTDSTDGTAVTTDTTTTDGADSTATTTAAAATSSEQEVTSEDVTTDQQTDEATTQVVAMSAPIVSTTGANGLVTVGLSVYTASNPNTALTTDELSSVKLTDLDGGKVKAVISAPSGTTTETTYTITLPDYLSFSNIQSSGTNYTSAVVSSDTSTNPNAVDNVLTITIPAPDDPDNPPVVNLDFPISLNRDSISDDLLAQWEAGTWEPNDGNTKFTIQSTTDASNKSELTATFVFSLPDNQKPMFLGADYPELSLAAQFMLDEHGLTVFNGFPSIEVSYYTADIYETGPNDVESIVLTAPDGFTFSESLPSSITGTLSNGNKTLTITADTSTANSSGRHITSTIKLVPDPQYLNRDDPMSMYPSGSSLPIAGTLTYKGGASYDFSQNFTINYTNTEELAQLTANPGVDSSTGSNWPNYVSGDASYTLYDVVDGDGQAHTQSAALVKITRNATYTGYPAMYNRKTMPNDGNGYSVTIDFDSRIGVQSFNVITNPKLNYEAYRDATSDSQRLAQATVKTIELTYMDGTTESVAVSSGTTTSVSAADGKTIASVKITYDKLVYDGGSSLLTSLTYTVPETDEAKVLLPITMTIADASGNQVASTTNYILLNGTKDPTFTITRDPSSSQITTGYYATAGTYSDGQSYLNYSYGIKDEDYSEALPDHLDNVWFYNSGNRNLAVGASDYRSGGLGSYFTNGLVRLHKVMGDGKWTVEVQVINAEDWQSSSSSVAPLETRTTTLPAFDSDTFVFNLADAVDLQDGEMIYSFTFKHEGSLDISSMYGSSTGDDAVDKIFYDVYVDALGKNPVTGSLFYGPYSASAYHFADVTDHNSAKAHVYAKFDNTQSLNKAHSEENYTNNGVTSRYGVVLKGGEAVVPTSVSVDSSDTTITQNATTTVDLDISYTGAIYNFDTSSRLNVQPGWVFYFKVNEDAAKYTTFQDGTGSIEGVVDPNSTIVEINGERYIKITYLGEATDKGLNSLNNGYEAINVSWQTYSVASTPVNQEMTLIDGGWIDASAATSWTHTSNGVTYTDVLDSGGNRGSAYGTLKDAEGQSWDAFVNYNSVVQDDPLSLHTSSAANVRNWALKIPTVTTTPNEDTFAGLSLNPGIDGEGFEPTTQEVEPNQEGQERVLLQLSAGDSDFNGVEATIKIPRKGDTVTYNGETKTQEVSQYLTGPLTEYSAPSKDGSTSMVVTYSTDGGQTYVSEDEITDWSAVTHIRIYSETLKAHDISSQLISLTTADELNNTGNVSVGNAYWVPVFSTQPTGAQTSRDAMFSYAGLTVSGQVFVDTNKNGILDDDESLYTGTDASVELLSGTDSVDTATVTDGAYTFTGISQASDLTAKITLPSGYGISVAAGTGQNQFDQTTKVATIGTITEDVTDVDAAIISITPYTDTISGTKTLTQGGTAVAMTDGQFKVNVTADSSNDTTGYTGLNSGSIDIAADGTFSTDEITFAKAGTYTFTVSEVDGGDGMYAYDDSEYVVTYTVTEDTTNNKLTATKTITKDGTAVDAITFANTKATAKDGSGVNVTKVLSGDTPETSETFSFTLAADVDNSTLPSGMTAATMPMPESTTASVTGAGSTSFGAITFSEPGVYAYTVTEDQGTAIGYDYDTTSYSVVYTVTADNGVLSVSGPVVNGSGDTATFTNTYTTPSPDTYTISGTKTLTQDGAAIAMTDGQFKVNVTADENNDTTGYTGFTAGEVDVNANGGFSTDEITFTKAGTYTFYVSEVDGGDARYTYDGTTYTVTVDVTLGEDNTLTATPTIAKDGDGTTVDAITFANTKESAQQITVSKVWDGISCDHVTVRLMNGDTEVASAVLSSENSWAYTFSVDGITAAGEDIIYSVTEDAIDGYTSAISGDEESGFVVTNTYNGITVSDPPVTKVVTGDEPSEDSEFTFTLTAEPDKSTLPDGMASDEMPMPEAADGEQSMSITITGSGTSEFGDLTFTQPGTYVYQIAEVNGGVEGYTYDESVYEVTYVVTEVTDDNGVTTLESTRTITKDGEEIDAAEFTFTNTYDETSTLANTSGTSTSSSSSTSSGLPLTGDTTSTWAALVAAIGGLVLLAIWLRRRRQAEQ